MPKLNAQHKIDITVSNETAHRLDSIEELSEQDVAEILSQSPVNQGQVVDIITGPWVGRQMRVKTLKLEHTTLRVYIIAYGSVIGPRGQPGKQQAQRRWLVNQIRSSSNAN